MKSTRRAFMQFLGAAVVGLTIALPTRTFGHDKFEPAPWSGEPMFKASAGLDRLIARSMEKRTALGAW